MHGSLRYFFVSGERSGDLHASNLLRALKEEDKHAEFFAVGGDYLKEAGAKIMLSYHELAIMGFVEAVKKAFFFKRKLREVAEYIKSTNTDVLILVDFSGFNLRLARLLKSENIPVAYYIAPKVWAWNQKRAWKIKKLVDKLYLILPFEKEFFDSYGIDSYYVGNPVLDQIKRFEPADDFLNKHNLNAEGPIVALLPGSRKQEIENVLNEVLKLEEYFPDFQWVVAGVGSVDKALYEKAKSHLKIKLIIDETYDLLHHADFAVVTSGTATLETALFKVPQMVVYRTSPITYTLAKRLVKVPFISLVNLIADKEVIKEFLQEQFTTENLRKEFERLIEKGEYYEEMKRGYDALEQKLLPAKASQNTAKLIQEHFKRP